MKKNKGFTLIELLVVITIIGILMSILLPAVGGAFKKAKTTRAYSEVRSLETAMKAFLQEYGTFPMQKTATDHTYTSGEYPNLITALRGLNSSINPRNIPFLEVGDESLGSLGALIDPWEGNYQVAADWNFDNRIEDVSYTGTVMDVSGHNVIVWSTNNPSINTWMQ